MDLRQLRYFIAVAEELHFGRAAARLFISQPALSFDIKKLEEQLGTQLLLRNNKSVKLTGAGQVLLVEARNLLQAEKVKRLTQLSAEGDVGQLRVGFVNSMLYRGLPRAMSRFEREHPNMEVVLGEMNSAEQAQALQRGQIDLGFVHWGRLPAEIVSEPLISDPFLCCLPAGHRLAGQARLDLAELRDEDFILFPRHVSPHYHDLIIARCVEAGFSPRIRHEARLWQTVAAMVGLGMGVALIPETLCLAWRNEVRYLEIEPAGARSEIHAILPASEPSRAAQAFLATLKSGLDDA
ncbi:TPA: LysR family transcriptional regulator [Pseudomonas aeruginosa]|nr:LysR family transcriptional regulator [Pseudomonas aeruginosa]HCG0744869.1 LysR family transcriptional regulator [Pseudomonas aeruginosa]HCG0756578.1 LysR family transcriptional regulator [Pseudomonas aeruginosa]HCG0802991.1 LysR family transcriptional regulator [Pseudomonas aeruginosa]HCG1447718.1 LysR family transcriptional regulator [Pseudomonas aeruginosa]